MKSDLKVIKKNTLYKVGLDKKEEAVISAHFMHKINQRLELKLYSDEEFLKNAVNINADQILNKILPSILRESENFIEERITAANIRVKENYKIYDLDSIESVGLPEIMTEVMFDRQFLRGHKNNYCRKTLRDQLRQLIETSSPIKMVVPSLPYKFSSPLKSRGVYPDFSEVNFLIGLAEICKTIDCIYRRSRPNFYNEEPLAVFVVISDGRRFNEFLNEPAVRIQNYQNYLVMWLRILKLDKYIKIEDYKNLISEKLSVDLKKEKELIKKSVAKQYNELLSPYFDPNNIHHTIKKAIELEPDPEENSEEGRFIPLFKSLIYIINYKTLDTYKSQYKFEYIKIYKEITKHIFEPFVCMTEAEYHKISKSIFGKDKGENLSILQIYEFLRRSMLNEAWNATIQYIAEIRSDRDLNSEPISTCLPDHIRWTIHAKLGQLAILTPTAHGDSIQAWSGVGTFKLTKKDKIKMCTLPVLSLDGVGAIPITINNQNNLPKALKVLALRKQPLFYIYPDIKFDTINTFIKKLETQITRKRKINV